MIRSTIKPNPIEIDEYRIYLNTNIHEVEVEDHIEYEYDQEMHDKTNFAITMMQNENKVVALVRERYSLNDELAILRQRDSKPEEFAEYNEYVEECKERAK